MGEIVDEKYLFDKDGIKATRVGQAAMDILSKDQPTYTAGEILDEYGPKYAEEIEKAINEGSRHFKSPFYVFVLTKKEMWATNVIRNYFVARQTPPYASEMMEQYPNHTKTLYLIDADRGNFKLVWSLPGFEDCKVVARHKDMYPEELVQWIDDCFNGRLNRDKYVFDYPIKPSFFAA